MEYSDFDLIRGIKSGSRSTLDILIRRWYSRIYGYTFKMIGHEQDAYDITQDVFVAVIQNIGSYHPWKNSIAIFLRSHTISVWATCTKSRPQSIDMTGFVGRKSANLP